jgi:hypothetical protein
MNVSTVTNHFSTANKGFITTLGSSILSGATTIPLTSVSGLTNGTIFVGIIEPGLPNEQEFTGTVDTAGVQITGVKWTDGTDVDHTAGVTIVDYVAATDWNMNTKGLLVSHDQDGTLKAGAVDVAGVLASNVVTYPKLESELQGGWNSTSALPAISTVVANGNRSYTLTHASSIASTVSPGMRRRFTRTVAGPTTAFSLDGSNDYYVKTSPSGMTFTDDFVVSAWVYLTAYQQGVIASRYNGTSGWIFQIGSSSGEISLVGFNAGSGNSSRVKSYQSIPLNKWTHITAQLDMSTFTATTTTSYVMIDGVNVPVTVERTGTNPTALVQAGNLEIGSANGGTLNFPGYIDQVAIYSAKVTQATILASMHQALTGSETSLISAYSNGSVTDLNANANNLTATNGATTVSSSWHGNRGVSSTLEYGLTMSVSSDGLTEVVQVPEGCALPTTGGITASAYSTMANPYGWVGDKGRWEVETRGMVSETIAIAGLNQWYGSNHKLVVPIGKWKLSYQGQLQQASTVNGIRSGFFTLSSAPTNASYKEPLTTRVYNGASSTTAIVTSYCEDYVSLGAATTYTLSGGIDSTTGTETWMVRGDQNPIKIIAIPSGL